MMDDSAPTHERKKLIKTYKNVFPEQGLWLLVWMETNSKEWEEKKKME